MTFNGAIHDMTHNRWEKNTSRQIKVWRDFLQEDPADAEKLAEFNAWVKAEGLEDGVFTETEEAAEPTELDGNPINPTHYQFPGGIQVIDLTRHLGFLEGNIVKYVARAGRKGAAKEDLLKARQYLDWLIEDTDA